MKYLYQGREFTTPEEIYQYKMAVQAAVIQWCTCLTEDKPMTEPRRAFKNFSEWAAYAEEQGIETEVFNVYENNDIKLAEGRKYGCMYAMFRLLPNGEIKAYAFSWEYIEAERFNALSRS